jgi:hypothetical protein
MPGLYDRLTNQIDDNDEDKPVGLSTLDIADLPEDQRRVMFLLMRDPKGSSSAGMALDELKKKLSDMETLPDVLSDLTKNGWLIRMGDPPKEHYRANLRRKRASKLGASLWASLSDHIAEEDDQPDDKGTDTGKPGIPALSDW